MDQALEQACQMMENIAQAILGQLNASIRQQAEAALQNTKQNPDLHLQSLAATMCKSPKTSVCPFPHVLFALRIIY